MEKNLKFIDSCNCELTMKVTKDEAQPIINKAFKEAQPKINLKGFRSGKVPISVIKKYYGAQIESESLQDISSEFFGKIVNEEKLQVVGQPSLKDIKPDEDGGYEFLIVFEIVPTVTLGDYKSIVVDEPVHIVDDEEIEKEIEKMCTNAGDLQDADEVQSELHVVKISIQELDDKTNEPAEGVKPQETQLFLADPNVLPRLKASLMDRKVGDSTEFKPGDEDPHAPNKNFSISVLEIQKLVPKEFNNEFVEKYTDGKFKTTEELRDDIGFKIQESWDQKSRQAMEDQLVEKIVDLHDFEVPESVVQNAIQVMGEDIKKRYASAPEAASLDISAMAEGLRPLAERTVKWEILRNEIIRTEKIEVEDHDVESLVEMEVERTKTDKEAAKKKILSNPNIIQNIMGKKVIDLLFDFIETNEVPFDDYTPGTPGTQNDDEDDSDAADDVVISDVDVDTKEEKKED
ncbi:MAG: trigger factor [Candidatus Kapabacteria bacterium]|nr:trigger factor [Candidatus Kapabacteria bacterium]